MEIRDRPSLPGGATDAARPIGRFERSGVLHPENLDRYAATRHEPDPAIGAVVDHFWTVAWNLPDGERIEQRILTDPAVTLTVEAGHVPAELVVTGVHRNAWTREIAGWGTGFAIRLRPAGLAVLSDLTPARIADRTCAVSPAPSPAPAGAPSPRRIPEVVDRRLAALLRAVAGEPDTPSRIARATALITAAITARPPTPRRLLANAAMDAITRGDPLPAGPSLRTVERALRETVGHGPAWLRRRVRLQEAARRFASDGESGAAAIAAHLGYADQSHLINEFRAATGRTPGEYLRSLALGS
ncbi:AraC family transcriptional regulator [Actinoplanes sp. NPDC023714]|uniref:AraC family transcriptional regulator n=1 Tax=Actinoplanes sp. NPDC023714 TaxID=3154322 RepID=UPI0033CC8206